MTDICERWLWRPPGEIIERLIARRRPRLLIEVKPHPVRDRYYTQARRLHLKRVMKTVRA